MAESRNKKLMRSLRNSFLDNQIEEDGDLVPNIILDTTPQLGGNLDLNGFNITGSGAIDITGAINPVYAQFVYTATANQSTFSGADDNNATLAYVAQKVLVFQNGVLLADTDDYTATNGTSIQLQSGALVNDTIQIVALSSSGGGGGGSVDLSAVAQDIIPDADNTYDLGSSSKQWAELHLAGGTFFLGGARMQTDPTTGAIAFIPKATASVPNPKGIVLSQDGKLKPVDTTGGSVSSSDFQDAANSDNSTPSTASYTNASDLPLTGVTAGTTAFVSATNRLYLFTGTGWYNIALVNNSPTITTGSPATVTLNTNGTATVLTLVATDPEEVPITWSYAVTGGSLTNGGGATATVTQSNNVFTITPTTTEAYAGTFSLTFSASDGVNTATSTGVFTLAFAFTDTNFASVVAFYDGSGVAGTHSSASFTDNSSNNFTVTSTGTTKQISTSPYYLPTGYRSVYFDGSNDDIRYTSSGVIPQPMEWLDGASDYGTYELFVKLDGTQITPSQTYTPASFGCIGGTYINFGVTNTGALRYYWWTGGSNYVDSTTTLSPNTWNHIALVRDSTTIKFYINGSLDATTQTNYAGVSWATGATGEVLYIGRGHASADADGMFKGHISNLRSSDIARYSGSSYTVPTSPFTSDANTLLLTCNDLIIADKSSNAYSLTLNDIPKVRSYYPDDITGMTTEYQPSSQGGSAYFANSGTQYLTVGSAGDFATGTGEFCFEIWFKQDVAFADYKDIWSTYDGSNGNFVHTRSNQTVIWGSEGTIRITSNDLIKLNTWYHLAIVRDSGGVIKMYLNGKAQTQTYTRSTDIPHTTNPLTLGYLAGFTRPWGGYLSDFRFVKGSAVYTSDFTPPTTPLSAITNTECLLKFGGYPLFERTGKEYLTTFNGNSEITDANYVHLRYASFYDGSGDYHTISSNSNRAIATNQDFTIETWIKVNAFTQYGHFATTYNNVGDDEDYFFRLNNTAQSWQFQLGSQNSIAVNSSTNLIQHKWHHLAVTRSSGTVYLWQDGVQVGSASDTQALNDNTVYLGQAINGYPLNAYMSDFRVVVGTAVYTSAFTPPTLALTAISGTQMLITSSASTVADASSNAATVTANGTVSLTKEVDHHTNMTFPDDVTGTLKFRGDTDYITVTNHEAMNLRDQDFTIDFWFKRDAVNSGTYGDTFICNVTGTGAIALAINPSGYTGVSYRNTVSGSWTKVGTDPGDTYGSVQVGLNKWTHYAVVRTGTTGYQFVNGVLAETFTFTGTITDWNGGMHFSHWHDGYTRGLIGEIFGFRITTGVARYTSAFSVPTEPPGRRN